MNNKIEEFSIKMDLSEPIKTKVKEITKIVINSKKKKYLNY